MFNTLRRQFRLYNLGCRTFWLHLRSYAMGHYAVNFYEETNTWRLSGELGDITDVTPTMCADPWSAYFLEFQLVDNYFGDRTDWWDNTVGDDLPMCPWH